METVKWTHKKSKEATGKCGRCDETINFDDDIWERYVDMKVTRFHARHFYPPPGSVCGGREMPGNKSDGTVKE